MQVSAEVEQRVYNMVEENIADAKAYYPNHNITMPTIHFDVRGTKAGFAKVAENEVHFNPILLMENVDDFINRTVPHEVAHIVDYIVNPQNFQTKYNYRTGRWSKRTIHGRTFKFIMSTVLGADDVSTYHGYDTSNAKTRQSRKFVWVSSIDGHEMILGIKRHRWMMAGTRSYWMRGKSNHQGYYRFSHELHHQPMQLAASTERPTEHIVGQTKKEKAKCIFDGCPDRKTFIARTQSELNMKSTTASTYWYNFNSGKW